MSVYNKILSENKLIKLNQTQNDWSKDVWVDYSIIFSSFIRRNVYVCHIADQWIEFIDLTSIA